MNPQVSGTGGHNPPKNWKSAVQASPMQAAELEQVKLSNALQAVMLKKLEEATSGWSCPVCGKGNAPSVTQCPCEPVRAIPCAICLDQPKENDTISCDICGLETVVSDINAPWILRDRYGKRFDLCAPHMAELAQEMLVTTAKDPAYGGPFSLERHIKENKQRISLGIPSEYIVKRKD